MIWTSIHKSAQPIHPEWYPLIKKALNQVDEDYLAALARTDDWLPGKKALFAAFSLPLHSVRYILLGESPYPRAQSANGYAFWDAAVESLWSETGLSKTVNRATSLRNWIKMLLYARGDLTHDFSQPAIARLNQSEFVQTSNELFDRLLHQHGFLLLNASLVYSHGKVNEHAKQWRPFISSLLEQLAVYSPTLQIILFGRIAQKIPEAQVFPGLRSEHPYNLSFITNPDVVKFFSPFNLLVKNG